MNLSQEFWWQLAIQAIFLSFFAGVIWTKLSYMEDKLEKHNRLVERMYNVENKAEKAHNRIDNVCNEIEDVRG